MATFQGQPTNSFQSASLYVGDLSPDLTEGVLFELFNKVGPVASIRVCRDAITRRSLGYGYVNFHNPQDAERALDTMNFTDIKANPADPNCVGRPCRIMWSQRDPTLRKSGVGNIFVKNLPTNMDNKSLFDTFSVCGNILSCKVATDENGVSKGYGYVHYETGEAAKEAIEKFNNLTFDSNVISVIPFVARTVRPHVWTNLYAKMFPLTWNEAKLNDLFSTCGETASVYISKDADGKSKGFGFVNFKTQEGAERAVAELANKTIEDVAEDGSPIATVLYVNRAQKKADRVREIKSKLQAKNEEMLNKYQGMNLYVKNIDDSVTDDFFRDLFSKYGTITSARIMREADGTSRGFGFVCYSSPEEASRAVTDQNGKQLRSKPLYVALHQRRDLRSAHLAATYAPRNMRFPQGPGGMGAMGGMPFMQPMFMQPGQQNFPPQAQRMPYPFQGQASFPPRSGNGSPRGMPFAAGGQRGLPAGNGFFPGPQFGAPPMQGPAGQQRFNNNRMQPVPGQPMPMGGMAMQQQQQRAAVQRGMPRQLSSPARLPQQQYMGAPMQQMGGPMPHQMQPNRPNVKFNNNVRNQQMGIMMPLPQQQQALPPNNMQMSAGLGEPLDDQALAQADPQQQKNMIGERLYPLIYVLQPELAGKITGMLLEMDNAELLNLIESPDALQHKIIEALNVLKAHQGSNDE